MGAGVGSRSLRLAELHLEAPAASLGALGTFYSEVLGLPRLDADDSFGAGASRLAWRAAGDALEPFYHFALLVPGQRLVAVRARLADRVELLRVGDDPVVTFADWNARALYFHDPAGNIVEFIAHRGIDGDGPSGGPFTPRELLGVSEAGTVVADKRASFEVLRARLGIDLLPGSDDDGALDDADDLAFVGERARTLILTSPGRGWLPTGRPAETHPLRVVLEGTPRAGRVALPGGVVVEAG